MMFSAHHESIQFTVCFNVKKIGIMAPSRRTVPAPDRNCSRLLKKETANDTWMYRHFPRLMAMKSLLFSLVKKSKSSDFINVSHNDGV